MTRTFSNSGLIKFKRRVRRNSNSIIRILFFEIAHPRKVLVDCNHAPVLFVLHVR